MMLVSEATVIFECLFDVAMLDWYGTVSDEEDSPTQVSVFWTISKDLLHWWSRIYRSTKPIHFLSLGASHVSDPDILVVTSVELLVLLDLALYDCVYCA